MVLSGLRRPRRQITLRAVSHVRSVRSLVAVAAAALVCAPSASAVTETPLGSCVADQVGKPVKLERITIPGTVSVAPDGTGRSSIGVSVRTKAVGPPVLVVINVFSLDGRPVANWGREIQGCSRLLVPLAEFSTPGDPEQPAVLRRRSAYVVSVTAASLLGESSPFNLYTALLEQVAGIRGGFLTR